MADLRHALLLTAGLGSRLQPLTSVRAKPAIPVAGEPLVRRIMQWLASGGVTDVVLNLHHLPATLTVVVGDGSDLGVRARYSWEQPIVLGSAGGPRQALPLIGAETFLIVNGDTLTDVDLDALASAHAASSALVTLALVPNQQPLRYGGLLLDDHGRVTGLARRGPGAAGSFHFIGVQVASAEAFRWLPLGEAATSIGGAYDRLMADRPGCIAGFVSNAGFWDIGTVADYITTSRALSETARKGAGRVQPSLTVHVHPGADVSASILWDNVTIGPDANVEECIVTDGVSVPAGSVYRRSILIQTPKELRVIPLGSAMDENLIAGP